MRSPFWSLLTLAAVACASGSQRPTPAPPIPTAPVDPRTAAIARLRADVDSMVADPQFDNAHWGILVVDPERRDTLYAHNAGKLFMPASNQKIITGAVALALLGPDYRWRTTYATRGTISGGTLRGDLIVVGRGDPTVSDNMRGDALGPLRAVADSLAARGVRRIRGGIVAEGDVFPGDNHGYGWAWDDFDFAYSAGVDELLFNEGFTRVFVRGGGRPNELATAWTAPATAYPPLRIEVTTLERGDTARARRRITSRRDSVSGGYVLTGGIAPDDSAAIELAYPNPHRAYLAALREALSLRGIAVETPTARATTARSARTTAPTRTSPAADTLFSVLSPPLREVLPAFEKPSQNQIGEMLLRTLGLVRTGVGTPDSGRKVVDAQLREWGVQPERDVAVRDGSGLSRHDYVTPGAIVRVLSAIRRDTAFRAFYDGLPIAGVDGTIRNRMKGTLAERNVHAKTGTVDKARSLSGYVTTADGRQLVFSFLCNNYTVPTRNVERVQDAIAARLAALGGTTAATSAR